MPYATNNGVRIYYEVEGAGPPLVLHHGLAGCGEDWRDFGLADVLKRTHRLILMDGRAFGASDKPHDPGAYGIAERVGDVTAVLDDLGLETAHYYGQSYGGAIGWYVAAYAPERLRSIVVTGAHPFAASGQAMRDLLREKGAEGFLAFCDQVYGAYMTPTRRDRLAANDFEALLALSQDRPNILDRLAVTRVPCLLISGESDPIHPRLAEAAALLPHAVFVTLPGCGHVDLFGRIDLVLPHVLAFLAKANA